MYTNKNSWTRKDGTYVERHYYVCSRAFQARGVECNYKAGLRKDIIEPDVIDAIRGLVDDPVLAEKMKAKIGTEVDTTDIDAELANYKENLKKVEKAKRMLERDLDSMSEDESFYEDKWQDKNKRLDSMYSELADIKGKIDDLILKHEANKAQRTNTRESVWVIRRFQYFLR